jgi:Domain of unknown function (DUF4136)
LQDPQIFALLASGRGPYSVRRCCGVFRLQTFADGFGGGGWRWRGVGGTGMSTTTTEVTKVGNVVVDVFDAHTQKLLWRGTDSQDLSSNADKNIQKLQKKSNNMFKHFPPKQVGRKHQ